MILSSVTGLGDPFQHVGAHFANFGIPGGEDSYDLLDKEDRNARRKLAHTLRNHPAQEMKHDGALVKLKSNKIVPKTTLQSLF